MKLQHPHTTGPKASKGGLLRALAGFEVGALAAVPVACFLPYEAFDSSVRGNLIASVCLGFLLLRVALRQKTLPATWGLVALAAGACLMTAGGNMGSGQVAGLMVLAGTAAMLLGLSIVIEAPRPSSARRSAEAQPSMEEDRPSKEDLVALLQGVGEADPVDLPPTAGLHHPAKDETSWHEYTAHRGEPTSA